jgi:hypothetical protein
MTVGISIAEARINGWLGEVGGLQVSMPAYRPTRQETPWPRPPSPRP